MWTLYDHQPTNQPTNECLAPSPFAGWKPPADFFFFFPILLHLLLLYLLFPTFLFFFSFLKPNIVLNNLSLA